MTADAKFDPLDIPEPPRPDLELVRNGGAWKRREYNACIDERVRWLRGRVLHAHGMAADDLELACRLLDDPALRGRIERIMSHPDIQGIRAELKTIKDAEYAERDAYLQICTNCGGDGAPTTNLTRFEPRFLSWCQSCVDNVMKNTPSTPPANGIRAALARARGARVPATLTVEQWAATVAFFEDRCAFCGGPWSLVEHATPITLGGGTTSANCLPACVSCNTRKASKRIEDLLPRNALVERSLAYLVQQGRRDL